MLKYDSVTRSPCHENVTSTSVSALQLCADVARVTWAWTSTAVTGSEGRSSVPATRERAPSTSRQRDATRASPAPSQRLAFLTGLHRGAARRRFRASRDQLRAADR